MPEVKYKLKYCHCVNSKWCDFVCA